MRKAIALLFVLFKVSQCYEYCWGYKDVLGEYKDGYTCSDYCCGMNDLKYCCTDACSSITLSSECGDNDTDIETNVYWIPIVAGIGGLVGFILVVSLLCYCCYKCCCSRRQQGAVILSAIGRTAQTTTTVTMNVPQTNSTAPPAVNPYYQPNTSNERGYVNMACQQAPPPYPGKY